MLRLLRAEQVLRDSPATQDAYDFYHAQGRPCPESVERHLQRRVLAQERFCPCEDSLAAYWRVFEHYSGDTEVTASVVYLSRTNISRPLCLRVGDAAPDAPLARYRDGRQCGNLLSHAKPGRPLVVAAGSYS